jgi:hypothetical protein
MIGKHKEAFTNIILALKGHDIKLNEYELNVLEDYLRKGDYGR